jgi:hypothetical protein
MANATKKSAKIRHANYILRPYFASYSISKSFVSRRRGEGSAVARRAEGNNDTNDLEMEL